MLSRVRLVETPWTTVHGILQARILEWVTFPFSRGYSQLRSPTLWADSLPAEPRGKPKNTGVGSLIPSLVDLPDLGIQLEFPALQADSLPAELPGLWLLAEAYETSGPLILRKFCAVHFT